MRPRKGKKPFGRRRDDAEKEIQNPFESEEFVLSPLSFFYAEIPVLFLPQSESRLTSAYGLPNLAQFLGEGSFAEVFLAWNSEGLRASVHVDKPFEQALFPEIQRGDSVELFFDTRNVKTSGFNTRFCHHFFFLPESVEGRQAGELTRFRAEETHEWCASADLQVKATRSKRNYTLDLFIPAHCLHGYDPDQFDHIGFTYRINRCGGPPQHFSVSSDDYQIEEQPSLWASLKLVNGAA